MSSRSEINHSGYYCGLAARRGAAFYCPCFAWPASICFVWQSPAKPSTVQPASICSDMRGRVVRRRDCFDLMSETKLYHIASRLLCFCHTRQYVTSSCEVLPAMLRRAQFHRTLRGNACCDRQSHGLHRGTRLRLLCGQFLGHLFTNLFRYPKEFRKFLEISKPLLKTLELI